MEKGYGEGEINGVVTTTSCRSSARWGFYVLLGLRGGIYADDKEVATVAENHRG